MKKLLTIAALAVTASLSFGQGYVNFQNAPGSRVSTNNVPSLQGGTGTQTLQAAAPAGSYYYALLYAPTTQTTVDNTLAGWTFGAAYATNTTAGRVSGITATDGTAGALVTGLSATATANFVVVGWSSNVGTSYAQALAWWNNGTPAVAPTGLVYNFGISGVALNIPLAPLGGPYNSVFGSSAITGIAMGSYINVPEPSTFALAGLGAAALLIFRRRK